MRIDVSLCVACGDCLPQCPLGVIKMDDVAVIDRDECVECGACLRSAVCPVDAFISEAAQRPFRVGFSDPLPAKLTGIAGRGTEEMKTNDVTGRFKKGRIGIAIEPGRPGTGARFYDIEKLTIAMAELGAHFEPKNPLTMLMDVKTGKIKEGILNEKVMSAVIECDFSEGKLKEAIDTLDKVAEQVDCVFSIACIGRAEADGSVPVEKMLKKLGIPYYPNGKTNLGMGRPLAEGDM
ncbi:MAG: 4Fe-4S dicluster domain-containing protein [Chloroflexota bacterium]